MDSGTLLILIFVLVGGEFYRLGGKGKPFNTLYRDIIVPLLALGLLFALGGTAPWWIWLLTFLCMFGSLTTYCKFGSQEDVYWYNWLLTGALYGLAVIPYAWYHQIWEPFAMRVGILALSIMIWSVLTIDVEREERGRGYLFVGTIPMLLQ